MSDRWILNKPTIPASISYHSCCDSYLCNAKFALSKKLFSKSVSFSSYLCEKLWKVSVSLWSVCLQVLHNANLTWKSNSFCGHQEVLNSGWAEDFFKWGGMLPMFIFVGWLYIVNGWNVFRNDPANYERIGWGSIIGGFISKDFLHHPNWMIHLFKKIFRACIFKIFPIIPRLLFSPRPLFQKTL